MGYNLDKTGLSMYTIRMAYLDTIFISKGKNQNFSPPLSWKYMFATRNVFKNNDTVLEYNVGFGRTDAMVLGLHHWRLYQELEVCVYTSHQIREMHCIISAVFCTSQRWEMVYELVGLNIWNRERWDWEIVFDQGGLFILLYYIILYYILILVKVCRWLWEPDLLEGKIPTQGTGRMDNTPFATVIVYEKFRRNTTEEK